MKWWKRLRFILCLVITYVLVTFMFNAPFQKGGGRILDLPNGYIAGFSTIMDIFEIYSVYEFDITHNGVTIDKCLLRPKGKIQQLRGDEDALRYDEETGEIIASVAGYELRKKLNPFQDGMQTADEDNSSD